MPATVTSGTANRIAAMPQTPPGRAATAKDFAAALTSGICMTPTSNPQARNSAVSGRIDVQRSTISSSARARAVAGSRRPQNSMQLSATTEDATEIARVTDKPSTRWATSVAANATTRMHNAIATLTRRCSTGSMTSGFAMTPASTAPMRASGAPSTSESLQDTPGNVAITAATEAVDGASSIDRTKPRIEAQAATSSGAVRRLRVAPATPTAPKLRPSAAPQDANTTATGRSGAGNRANVAASAASSWRSAKIGRSRATHSIRTTTLDMRAAVARVTAGSGASAQPAPSAPRATARATPPPARLSPGRQPAARPAAKRGPP